MTIKVVEAAGGGKAVFFLHYLRAELLSALGAASCEDVPTALGRHSRTETVHFASVSLLGLIRSFHILNLTKVFLLIILPMVHRLNYYNDNNYDLSSVLQNQLKNRRKGGLAACRPLFLSLRTEKNRDRYEILRYSELKIW